MISSFWNLCRACPSMPVEKQLHSEYRSTFQWHEYVGNRADPSSLTQQHQPQQPQQNQLAVVRQPHRSTQSQVLWASAAKAVEETIKRKRHPDILNRTSNGWTTKSTADEIRSQNQVSREQKQVSRFL
ncbi:unnamed protein product [Orchesella dallaii]|uniref:Uncharacterized protein n=1 Tax=Orchesella dallaii TaxID=48710 RepID=A0ABP1RKY1_9HEXA